ncbi:p48/p45 [Sucra jujuba nucleopolyhedrovirus]|uniref:p48/p45 n=1 Tax=Sucra jujuba nucleopolyhedrovirus TaxID=1563660 RepID=A0A097P918_9ABAC|nr:p48/p45 [Sucra jujuba nucleopolyhedrovirus]AIU41325.1 p48/p45 [Sucra jujuba nucleopolyhedrovirus]
MNNNVALEYSLRFEKTESDVKTVNFVAHLNVCEIDSLVFLFSKYYDQCKNVKIKGLTFFNEFNKCVDIVKQNLECKQESNEIKQLFTVFLKHEFMSQVPNFRKIMQYLDKYFKPVLSPDVHAIYSSCLSCATNSSIECLTCKVNYLSQSLTMFDKGIRSGWDIFLRPMFGMPIFVYVLMKTQYDSNGVFSADDLITNVFAVFLYNLLSDKSIVHINFKQVQPLVSECKRATLGINYDRLEYLLCMLRSKNTGESVIFAPFKTFILQMAQKTKIKTAKINKIAAVIFTGFFLRLYIEGAMGKSNTLKSAPNKGYPFDPTNQNQATPFELELRNVCRFIMTDYNDQQFEQFIAKLALVKQDLSVGQYIVTEKHMKQLISKHNLLEDFAVLVNKDGFK